MNLRISVVTLAALSLVGCKTMEGASGYEPSRASSAETAHAASAETAAAPDTAPRAHGSSPVAARVAVANLEGKSGKNTSGTATFTRNGDQITMILEVNGLQPGTTHAAHIHEKGDCSAPDAASAGPHWNPTNQPHGQWGHAGGHHLGDLGNLTVSPDGNATMTVTTDQWTIGTGAPNDILNHAIVIHAAPDDFTSQPAGNAGARVGCGVIKSTSAP